MTRDLSSENSDVRLIRHVVDLEQELQSLERAFAERVADLRIRDHVIVYEAVTPLVREVRHLADVLGAVARRDAGAEAVLLVVQRRVPDVLRQAWQRNVVDCYGADRARDGNVALGVRVTQDRAEAFERIRKNFERQGGCELETPQIAALAVHRPGEVTRRLRNYARRKETRRSQSQQIREVVVGSV